MPTANKAEGGKSKIDAVREIIGKHGKTTMPVEIVDFAKKEHGVKLTPGTASNYKTTVLKELSGGKAKRGLKSGWKKAASNGAAKNGVKISIEDIEAVKKLVEQVGADKVEQLAKVLAK